MSDLQVIKRVRHQEELLALASASLVGKGDGRISYANAKRLFVHAMQRGHITRTERRTLKHILHTYNITSKARKYLETQLSRIDGTKHYDLDLIHAADAATQGRSDGRISMEDALPMMDMLHEKFGKMTNADRRTMQYILASYKCTWPAIALMKATMGD